MALLEAAGTDHIKQLFRGHQYTEEQIKEVQKQRVQAYAAELEAQIRAKQDRRRAERNASLMQSQDLLAARHAAPLAALPMGGQLQAGRRLPAAEAAMEWHNGFWQPPKERPKPRHQSPPQAGWDARYPPHSSEAPSHPHRPANQRTHQNDRRYQDYDHRHDLPQPQIQEQHCGGRGPEHDDRSYQAPRSGRDGPREDAGMRPGGYGDARRPRGGGGRDGEEAGARALADRQEAARMTAAALQKLNYRAELEAQLRERDAAKRAERRQRMVDDLRMAQEAAAYNPWGRAGCGAPLRSSSGRAIADLTELRKSKDKSRNASPEHDRMPRESSPAEVWRGHAADNGNAQARNLPAYAPSQKWGPAANAYPNDRAAGAAHPPPRDYSGSSHPRQDSHSSPPHEPQQQHQQQQQRQRPSAPYDEQPASGWNPPGGRQHDRGDWQARDEISSYEGKGGYPERRPGGHGSPGEGNERAAGSAEAVEYGGQAAGRHRVPVYFRGDMPHMTAAERTNKQTQAQALQSALRKQIEERKAAKAADAMREKEQDAAEEARLAAEQQRLRDKAQEDKARQHVRQSQQEQVAGPAAAVAAEAP
ncbi:hypothetical protein WJX84_004538, partial [Apatococcus fuscideae]